jgi:hypothetical protein
MDTIPMELIDRISSYLEHNDLKNTLLVSKAFSLAAEKYSHAFSQCLLREDNFDKFVETYSGHRFSYLRELQFWIELPRVDFDDDPYPRDNIERLQQNDKSLTQQVRFLFDLIKTAEGRAKDQGHAGKIFLIIYASDRMVASEYITLAYPSHLSWRSHLLEPEHLPMLDSIRSLEVRKGCQDALDETDGDWRSAIVRPDYRVIIDLAAKCPNLEFLGCCLGGDEWQRKWGSRAERYLCRDWAGPRRDTRKDFAKAMESVRLPKSLQRINLDFLYDLHSATTIDHFNAQPNLVMQEPNDPFSISLGHLCHQLRRVNLRIVADESLFWPRVDGGTAWPNLESFVIMFHMVSPSGTWYFQGLHGEGRNMSGFEVIDASYPPLDTTEHDEDMLMYVEDNGHIETDHISSYFRIVPNDDILRPFLEGFARATSQMKLLKEAAVWCPLSWGPEGDYYGSNYDSDEDEHAEDEWVPESRQTNTELAWGIYYRAAGEEDKSRPDSLPSEARQLWWMVSKWRPDPELHGLYQQIGRREGDDELIEHWFHDPYAEKLVHQWYFEAFLHDKAGCTGHIAELS